MWEYLAECIVQVIINIKKYKKCGKFWSTILLLLLWSRRKLVLKLLFSLLQMFDCATISMILSNLAIVWMLFCIPVLKLHLLSCEICNFVLVEFFQYICTLSSVNFKAIYNETVQIFCHLCFQIICYMDVLKDKINVFWYMPSLSFTRK